MFWVISWREEYIIFLNQGKGKLVAAGGQQRWSGNSHLEVSWNVICRMRFEGSRWCRELCKWAICHRDNLQKREGKRGRGGEWKRGTSCHTHRGLRDPSSPPLQQLWTLSFFLALTRVRGTPIQLHASFQRRMDWIEVTTSSPETLRVYIGKEVGKLDRWISWVPTIGISLLPLLLLAFQLSSLMGFLFFLGCSQKSSCKATSRPFGSCQWT